jgi:hypothetical protein
MFNPFYAVLPIPETSQRNYVTGLAGTIFSCIILAFNAAGQLHTGLLGLIGLLLLFLTLGTVGCYWYVASIHFLGQCFKASHPLILLDSTTDHPSLKALQGLWPLILLGPAVSAQRWWPSAGTLMTLGVILLSGFTLIVAIRHTYNIRWSQASLCLFLTMILGSLALGGLIGWPVMFLLGAKYLSIILCI